MVSSPLMCALFVSLGGKPCVARRSALFPLRLMPFSWTTNLLPPPDPPDPPDLPDLSPPSKSTTSLLHRDSTADPPLASTSSLLTARNFSSTRSHGGFFDSTNLSLGGYLCSGKRSRLSLTAISPPSTLPWICCSDQPPSSLPRVLCCIDNIHIWAWPFMRCGLQGPLRSSPCSQFDNRDFLQFDEVSMSTLLICVQVLFRWRQLSLEELIDHSTSNLRFTDFEQPDINRTPF
ncbi:hypothetical protein AALP_AA3G286100 [Arabis alpina]|uniref:Uncharacterized protein n=1 Tax=Arabis alpina TaxID=50452 RepID=A0A087HCC3_ARAAL|nr:hypothetical protein AALP_AA3G286100 [Arabis alpina]